MSEQRELATRAILVAAFLVAAAAAGAQTGGVIGLFSDDGVWSDCEFHNVGGTGVVYVVHTGLLQASGSQFMVSSRFGPALDVDFHGNLHIGSITDGVAVTYAGCKPLPHVIATITFFSMQMIGPCSAFSVVADPALPSGQIEAVDCESIVLVATGTIMCVNKQNCCVTGDPGGCLPMAVEASTWGSIKSLYR